MSTTPLLFEGRPSQPFTNASPREARRVRKCWPNLWWALACLATAPIFFGLFLPLGVAVLVGVVVYAVRFLQLLYISETGVVKAAPCPACEGGLLFWTAEAFPCVHCKRLLMAHGQSLYDIRGKL